MNRFFLTKTNTRNFPNYLTTFSKRSFSDKFRVEHDTFGPIDVPVEKYWAAQTQRSLQNFAIGTTEDKMPLSIVRGMAIIMLMG